MSNAFHRKSVAGSQEFDRIERLPRRSWSDHDLQALAAQLTALLKTPDGTQQLRPVQALSLHDIGVHGGLFGPIRVSGGKTLISLLAPYILDSVRPVLILPAALVEKTEHDRKKYQEHWRIPRNLRLLSYEMLGRVQAADTLAFIQPDLIICDEVHRVKNRRAGVTRRLVRYMKEHPGTHFVGISGTVMKSGLQDFAHILRWCLKEGAPIPSHDGELEEWADALDDKVNFLQRRDPGALLRLCSPEDRHGADPLQAARRGFQRRLTETPGVVATSGESVSCSLYVRALTYPVAPVTEQNFTTLRQRWETPDGYAFSEAVAVWRHARELALGFHYVWDPRPPEEWMLRRRIWAQFVRAILSKSRTLDTELQVALACKHGDLGDAEYLAWKEIKSTFSPTPKAVWHDGSALTVCQKWMKQGPGIVWVEHTFFAEELSKLTRVPYYGAEGKDRLGNPIEKADPKKPLIASTAANSTGRNLQAWSRNLITAAPANASAWEQLLGRTHRDGQLADQVEADVLLGCKEHFDAWTKARAGAEMARDTLGQSQKLLISDCVFPDIETFSGDRWVSR